MEQQNNFLRNKCPYCLSYEAGNKENACGTHWWQNSQKVRYATFKWHNLGYSFEEKSTGKLVSKLIVWQLYYNKPRHYVLLTNGTHPDYARINSPNWKNGEFQGDVMTKKSDLVTYHPIFLHEKDDIVVKCEMRRKKRI